MSAEGIASKLISAMGDYFLRENPLRNYAALATRVLPRRLRHGWAR